MPLTRKADDLYVLGMPFTLNDGEGEPVDVWLQKIDPLDSETALRRAGAAKARVLMVRNTPDSDEWLELYADVADFDRMTLTEYLIADDVLQFGESREAEVAAEEEWSKDNYLQGLTDAWRNDLKTRWENDPTDAEAAKCLAEMTRFRDQVDKLVDGERERLRKDWEDHDIEDMRSLVVTRFLESRANQAWAGEWRRCELAFGVRQAADHATYYFVDDKGEVNHDRVRRLPPEVFGQLTTAYGEMVVPPDEGKGLPPTPSSSPPLEPSAEAETAPLFGPPVVVP